MRCNFFLAMMVVATTIHGERLPAQTTETDARFTQWDSNEDGVLDRTELPTGLRKNFDRVDTDNSGTITLAEHLEFLHASRPNRDRNNHSPKVPPGTTVHLDLTYVENGHERQKLDLYIPTSAARENRLPLIVWVHGGGWRKGSKSNPRALRPLLQQGFAVASINYRLSEHATFPAQIHDCFAAIRYLRTRADEFHYDGERIGAWGSSAGGHLVALMGSGGDVEFLQGELGVTGVSSRVQAVCDWFGPTDLLAMNEQAGSFGKLDHNAPDSPESKLIGGPIQQQPEKTARASPIAYVSPDDPPYLIMHGDQDPLVPLQQSQLLYEALQKSGVKSELVIVEGAGHGLGQPEHMNRVIAFFKSQLNR